MWHEWGHFSHVITDPNCLGWTSFIFILPKLYRFYKYFFIFTSNILIFPFSLVLNNTRTKPKTQTNICASVSLSHTLNYRPDPLSNSQHLFLETWTSGEIRFVLFTFLSNIDGKWPCHVHLQSAYFMEKQNTTLCCVHIHTVNLLKMRAKHKKH